MSKFCMYSFIHLTYVPSVVYILAVGHETLTGRASRVYVDFKEHYNTAGCSLVMFTLETKTL